jgi:hypothetical protein
MISIVAIASIAGGLLADFVIPITAKQHIYNPNWPPHAKFHNGQTISLGILLGILSLFLLFRTEGDHWFQFILSTITASYYWLSLIFAGWFPYTDWVDPDFRGEVNMVLGLHPQQFLSYIMIILLITAFFIGYIAYI